MRESQRSVAISEAVAARQRLSTSRQSMRSQGTSPARRRQATHTVYFNMYVYDMSDPNDPEQVEMLRAGTTYLLAITCDDHPSSMNTNILQDGQPITDSFSLALSYSYDSCVTTPITPSKSSFPFQSTFPGQHTHEFALPADFPSCNITIQLKLRTPQRHLPMSVTSYTLPACGQEPAAPAEVFEIGQIHQRLPAKTALLLVEKTTRQEMHKQCIRMRGWDESGLQLDDAIFMNTIVSIEELQAHRYKQKKKAFRPDELLRRLNHFSYNNSLELLRWLNNLFAEHQEQLHVVIVDLTEKEIPWELLEFDPHLYLGACVRVVRWLPTHYFRMERKLSFEATLHEGPVISYLDEQLGVDLIQHEQEALKHLYGWPYLSLSDLNQRLKDSLETVGLIYIGCHGVEGKHLLQQNVPALSSIMLDIYACKTPRLTVFINACESARTIKKNLDDRSSFVEVFLARCASGFIGTLARVEIPTASMIARQILLATLQPGGVQIAEQLRLLRNNVVEQLQNLEQSATATPDDYYRMIDTFMYVYYGNPLARLQLRQREGTEQ